MSLHAPSRSVHAVLKLLPVSKTTSGLPPYAQQNPRPLSSLSTSASTVPAPSTIPKLFPISKIKPISGFYSPISAVSPCKTHKLLPVDVAPRTVLVKLSASDADLGANAQLRFSFADRTTRDQASRLYFSLDT